MALRVLYCERTLLTQLNITQNLLVEDLRCHIDNLLKDKSPLEGFDTVLPRWDYYH